jgi:hypothetical protein
MKLRMRLRNLTQKLSREKLKEFTTSSKAKEQEELGLCSQFL